MIKNNAMLWWMFFNLILSFPAFAAERFNDEDLREFLEQHGSFSSQPHAIMSQERQRMSVLLTAFLNADTQTLNEESKKLVTALSSVINNYEPTSGKDAAMAWQLTAAIVNETYLMRDGIQENDYKTAYTHFSRIGGLCIRCHESVRSWGKFGNLKLPTPEGASVETGNEEKLPVNTFSKKGAKKTAKEAALVSR